MLPAPTARGGRSMVGWPVVAAAIVAGLVEMALLAVWQRNGYWDFSDGVYALSAREFLHGLSPYRDFAAAQPPPVFVFGALLLAVHDGIAALRAGLALIDLATAGLVGVCVWRVSRRTGLALAAAAVAPLLPISLHEHAQLTPETLAAALIMAGALCCSRRGGASWGAALLTLAVACKLAFAVPALAVAMVSPSRRRAMGGLVGWGVILGVLSLAVFGTGVWREAVEAQLQVGRASAHYVGGLLAQGAWNEFPLVIGASAAVWFAATGDARVSDPALLRTLTAAACGALVIALSVVKRGSYINVLVVAEPPLLSLAVCGAAWSFDRWRQSRVLIGALATLLAVQSLSLLVSPQDPWAAKRPLARSGLAWSAGPSAIRSAVAAARRCPERDAYSGTPYVAFMAARRLPGEQPDLFMLRYAADDARFAQRAARDEPRCP